ncbi:TPA: hypothetical protein N3A33_004148 [Salmonella enterica subsp. salamae serovar 28:r:e,n,z15]|nr:hypothetical protein [Salmonella enterica subsp. salamae serovar 28:r:e,n,z15]
MSLKAKAKSVQDRKVCLVDTVHVTGNGSGHCESVCFLLNTILSQLTASAHVLHATTGNQEADQNQRWLPQ